MSQISDAGKAPRKRPTAKKTSKQPSRKSPAKPGPKSRSHKGKADAARTGTSPAPRKGGGTGTGKSGSKTGQRGGKARWKDGKKPAAPKGRPPAAAARPGRRSGPEGIAARDAATVLLHNVLVNHRPLDELLINSDHFPELASLSKADRGFARAIAATALRRHGQLLEVIGHFMEKGFPERSGPLREILLGAAAQLLFLDSPPHAVLNIAVQQVKRDRHSRRYDKLANAVLRRISEKGPALIKAQEREQKAGRLNTPNWLWNSWCKSYDKQTAQYIAEAHLHQARLDLSVREKPGIWAKKLGGTLLPTGSVRLKHKGRIETIEGFEDGEWWVQDAAAALPVRLMGNIRNRRVADLAAAPGGKTAQMIAAGAQVTAIDWSPGRLRRLSENLERLEMEAEIIEGNILDWEPEEKFDAVLLDAPCTSTGTIRRHPDLPFLKRQSDVSELAEIQAKLLDKALTFVKPGGTLLYCTCSLQDEEGGAQIRALLKRNKSVKTHHFKPEDLAGHAEWITPDGHLRTLPFHRPDKKTDPGMDGFFAARLIVRS